MKHEENTHQLSKLLWQGDYVFVSGTFGNIVFHMRMGKACARIKRTDIKQTVETKKTVVNFGVAARAGKLYEWGPGQRWPILQTGACKAGFWELLPNGLERKK